MRRHRARTLSHGLDEDTTARLLDWSLPGGQDHYFKAIADLAAGDGFIGEKVMAYPVPCDARGCLGGLKASKPG